MSGPELAGLALGVVPIFFEILKSYAWAREKLETFKRYHDVVHEIQLDFRLQECAFRTECELLLTSIVKDKQGLSSALQHPNDAFWNKREVEVVNEGLKKLLGDDYAMYEDVVVKIRDMLRVTRNDLEHLSKPPGAAGVKILSVSTSATQQIRDAFSVTSKESRYRKTLDSLNIWNTKFRSVCKQKFTLQKVRHVSSASITPRRIPATYASIHEASSTIHTSLEDAWSCSNASHDTHQAKLLLSAEADHGKVRLDMAISCRQKDTKDSTDFSESPVWFYVQSVTTRNDLPSSTTGPTALTTKLVASLQPMANEQVPMRQPQSLGATLLAAIKRGKKRVRARGETSEDEDSETPTPKEIKATASQDNSGGQCLSMMNLRDAESFCCHLSQTCTSADNCRASCLGFLEGMNDFRFIFYDAGKKASTEQHLETRSKEVLPLDNKIGFLPQLERLMLAHKLASAVLQYYSTPWPPEDWRLGDFSFLGNRTEVSANELVEDLQTLHLSTQFPKKGAGSTLPGGLHSWKSATKRISAASILVRSSMRSSAPAFSPMAPTQTWVPDTKKSYEGVSSATSDDDDLDSGHLRNAVYANVVCELEYIIGAYKGFWTQA